MSRNRILANVQDRRTGVTPEVRSEEDAAAAARDKAAERILSKPSRPKQGKLGRKKPPARSITKILLLAAIGIGGIAAIIGLRYLTEAFGIHWIGD